MTDKSAFTDAEWHALTDAPLLITTMMFAAGEHGPISMVKESSASARLLTSPGDRGPAAALVAQIAPEARGKQSRHDAQHHKGSSMADIVAVCLNDLGPAAAAVHKLPDDEATALAGWFFDIASAVAAASKDVSTTERDALDKLAAVLGVPSLPKG